MGRKGKSKGRKARAASGSTSAERGSESSEAVSEAVSAASSLVGDEDDRSSLVAAVGTKVDEAAHGSGDVEAAAAVEDVQGAGAGEATASIGEIKRSGVDEDVTAVQYAEATTEEVAGDPISADKLDESAEEGVEEQHQTVVTEEFAVEEHHIVTESVQVEQQQSEASAAEEIEHHTSTVATEVVASNVHRSEAFTTENEHFERTQAERVVEQEVAVEEHHHTTSVLSKEFALETSETEEVAIQESRTKTVVAEYAAVEDAHAETAATERLAVEEVRAEVVEFAAEERHDTAHAGVADEAVAIEELDADVVEVDEPDTTQTEQAAIEAVTSETVETKQIPDEEMVVAELNGTEDTVVAEQVAAAEEYSETIEMDQVAVNEQSAETVTTEESAIEEDDEAVETKLDVVEHRTDSIVPEETADTKHSEAIQLEQAGTEVYAPVTVEVEQSAIQADRAETIVAEKLTVAKHAGIVEKTEQVAVIEEQHSEIIETGKIVVLDEHRDEIVVAKEEEPAMELHKSASVSVESSGEHQSVSVVESHTDATTAMASQDEDISDKVVPTPSTADADLVDHKTRSRPMLTTERSFVMENDDTVKADDTVVVSERMSTDGEDDFEDMTPQPSEGFQAAVIANSMSSMLGKQNGKSLHRRSSATAPTASSAARRSSEDHTPNVTPTRVRSRSRSGSRQSTPDTGFVKPAPAPPTVPVPPKRASIMAPTASYAAKHQVEDAPKKTPTRARSHSSEAKPEISDTGFIKPPPAPPTVPIAPKRASIMAPTASYAAKHQVEDAPKKTPPRVRTDKHAKPEISDTGFIKPPPAPPTVPVPPKRASIMAPTASSSAKRGQEAATAAVESKVPHRPRRSPGAKPEISDTGFVKPPPPPPTVPIAPKRASIMAPTASSAAKRGGPDVAVDDWSRDAPPKPAVKTKTAEFAPTVPLAPKRASIMAPTASFRAKSGPEVVVEDLPPPPVETKLYRNKRYANVQSKVRNMMNAPGKPTEPKPSTMPVVEEPKPVQKPTLFKSKRYANVQSKIKNTILSGPSQPDPSAVERRRSLGGAKHDTVADAVRRRSSLAGTSTLRSKATGPGSGSGSDSSDPFAQALASRTHKKKVSNAVPRYLSYENSGVYAQRAQVQQDRRRRLEEQNASKSQTRQHQLRVVFAEKLHVNYNAQEAEHSQAALGNVGARARRVGGRTRGSRSSSASDELSTSSESKPAPVAVAGGVIVLPSVSANGSNTETVVETSAAVKAAAAIEVDAGPQTSADDGVTKKINFDDTSDDEEDEVAVPVADVA